MLPCERMAKYYIPALRVTIAKDLSKMGKTQTEIAALLGITQAAVNKYLTGNYSPELKRFEKSADVRTLALRVSENIIRNNLVHSDVSKLMMENCSTLSGCGIKH